jgi:hypothetical protein
VPRLTKTALIDAIVNEVSTYTGDERDGAAPPITVRNFHEEMFRYGAKELRKRLSRMSLKEVLRERDDKAWFDKEMYERGEQLTAIQERDDREAWAKAFRQQQAERGRRHGPQPEILEAARHYRARGHTAGEAWDLIKKEPFKSPSGATIRIDGPAHKRLSQTMRVISPDGKQLRCVIRFSNWRQLYWPAS